MSMHPDEHDMAENQKLVGGGFSSKRIEPLPVPSSKTVRAKCLNVFCATLSRNERSQLRRGRLYCRRVSN